MNWAEVVNNLVTSKSFFPTLGFVTVIIVLAILGIKQGWFSFKKGGLVLGKDENERRIIRQQMEYVNTRVEGLATSFNKSDFDYYRTKYILCKVCDFYENIIIYNHIKDDDEYINLKADMLLAVVLKRTDKEYFRSEEFKKWLYDTNKEIIKRLVLIRKTYKGE